MKKTAILILCAFFFARAATPVGGTVKKEAFTAAGNPYIVESDLHIPEGAKLEIGEGCVFMFNNFTGITVDGDLTVSGSSEKPVVFTSIFDADYNPEATQLPNPFDWNGITLTKKSDAVLFKNFTLKYSSYGIKSQNKNVKIRNGIFRQNGSGHFTINLKFQHVQDNVPFSFNVGEIGGGMSMQEGDDDQPGAGSISPGTVPAPKKKRSSTTRIVVRYSLLGASVISLATGVVLTAQASEHKRKRDNLDVNNPPPGTTPQQAGIDWNNMNTNYENATTGSIVCYSLGSALALGFVLTFVF